VVEWAMPCSADSEVSPPGGTGEGLHADLYLEPQGVVCLQSACPSTLLQNELQCPLADYGKVNIARRHSRVACGAETEDHFFGRMSMQQITDMIARHVTIT
jgi:hypothetical protein